MTTTAAAEPINWTTPQKIAFRFLFIFFALFIVLDPNGVLPFYDNWSWVFLQPLHLFIPWFAGHMLHLKQPITIFSGGSGDTTYDYVVLLFKTILAVIGAGIWSVTGRNTRNYNKLYYWLCVIIRYYVGITMLSYGAIKVVKLQFPDPSLGRLMERVGDMSPMGLAWTYMGHSVGFNLFTGLAEVTCGALLLFRRTTTLGAIMGIIVGGNIMAINYCFDVPVKILSTMLVVMSVFLLCGDYRRLINFFLSNKEAAPSNLSAHRFQKKWKNITLTILKYVLIAYVVFDTLISVFMAGSNDDTPKPKFYGIYNVQTFIRGHDTLPPLTTDTIRWRRLLIGARGNAITGLMNDSMKYYNFKADTQKRFFIFSTDADTVHKIKLSYIQQKPDALLLTGLWKNDSIKVKLVKYDLKKFRLLNKDFHWVNEYPYNR